MTFNKQTNKTLNNISGGTWNSFDAYGEFYYKCVALYDNKLGHDPSQADGPKFWILAPKI